MTWGLLCLFEFFFTQLQKQIHWMKWIFEKQIIRDTLWQCIEDASFRCRAINTRLVWMITYKNCQIRLTERRLSITVLFRDWILAGIYLPLCLCQCLVLNPLTDRRILSVLTTIASPGTVTASSDPRWITCDLVIIWRHMIACRGFLFAGYHSSELAISPWFVSSKNGSDD